MRALVTGSAGFVGRHMVDRLTVDGWTVYSADIKRLEHAGAESVVHDVRQWWEWRAVPTFDLVVHCAAVVGGRTMIDGAPLELACHDLAIDAAFFDWCRRARPRHVVYYSSSAAYPVRWQQNDGQVVSHLSEWMMQRLRMPDQTYGWVKLTGERLAVELAAACPDVAVHVLRPFSGYGEDQDLAYPFPAIAQRAARGDLPVKYWGAPDQVRDWVHIDDVIGATLAIVAADHREPTNICTGLATRFEDLAMLMADLANRSIVGGMADVACVSGQPTGVHYRVGDPSTMLGFYTPTVSVEEGARRAVAYAKEHRC